VLDASKFLDQGSTECVIYCGDVYQEWLMYIWFVEDG